MERAFCAVIQGKGRGDEVVKQLQCQRKSIIGERVDLFSIVAIVEEEEAAI